MPPKARRWSSAIAAGPDPKANGKTSCHPRFSQVQSKFTSALVYPAFVSVVGICIVFFFMSYMLPKFMSIFQGMNVQLPMMTQILVNISHLFSGYWWAMLAVALAVIIAFKRFQASTE